MPKIRVHNAQVAAQGRLNVRRMSGSDFGGSGLIQAGKEITEFAGQLEVQAEKKANMWVDQALADYRLKQSQRLTDLEQEAELGAPDFTASYKEEVTAINEEMMGYEGLTPTAKGRLKLGLTNTNASLFGRSVQFEGASRASKQKIDFTKANENRVETLATNPEMYTDVVNEARGAAETAFPKMNATKREELLAVEIDKLGRSAFNGTLERANSPEAAAQLEAELDAKNSLWKDRLSSDDYAKAKRMAESNVITQKARVKQAENENLAKVRVAQSAKYFELLRDVREGRKSLAHIQEFRDEADTRLIATGSQLNSLYSTMDVRDTKMETGEQKGKIADIMVAINDATVAGDADVLEGLRETAEIRRENGEITDSAYTRAVIATNSGLVASTKDARDTSVVMDAIATGTTLSHGDSGQRKAVDGFYTNVTASEFYKSLTPEGQQEYDLQLIKSVGIIPRPLLAKLQGGLASQDPNTVVTSAQQISTILAVGGNIAAHPNFADSKGMARALDLNEMFRITGDAQKAYDMVEAANDRTPELREARKAAYRKVSTGVDGITASNYLTDKTDSDLPVPPEMAAALDKLAGNIHLTSAHPDPEKAREQAWKIMQGSWGVSTMGGSGERWMKNAPELRYGKPGLDNAKWMREQLKFDLDTRKNELAHLDLPDDIAERADLVVDPRRAAPDGKPVYMLQYMEDGVVNVVPLTWNPDYTSSPAGIALKNKKLGDARIAETQAIEDRKQMTKALKAIDRERTQLRAQFQANRPRATNQGGAR